MVRNFPRQTRLLGKTPTITKGSLPRTNIILARAASISASAIVAAPFYIEYIGLEAYGVVGLSVSLRTWRIISRPTTGSGFILEVVAKIGPIAM